MHKNKFLNRKILLLLSSCVTIASAITCLAITTNNDKKVAPLSLKENSKSIDEVLNNIKVDIQNKEENTVYDVKHDLTKIQYSNFDNNKYVIIDQKIVTNNKYGILALMFKIKDKTNDQMSLERTEIFNGLKVEKSLSIIFKNQWEDTTINYLNRKFIPAKLVDKNKLLIYGFDQRQSKIDDLKISLTGSNSVTIELRFRDIETSETSDWFSYILGGFGNLEEYEKEEKIFQNAILGLGAKVKNKANIDVNDVKKQDIDFVGTNDQYKLTIKSIEKNSYHYYIKVIVELISTKNPIIKENKEIQILGFKNTGITNEEFEKNIKNIKIFYKNKKKILAENAIESDANFSGFDTEKLTVTILDFTPNPDDFSIDVRYYLQDRKTSNFSRIVNATIPGFFDPDVEKKLNKVADNIQANVKNKDQRKVSSISIQDINLSGYDDFSYIAKIKELEINEKDSVIDVLVKVNPFNDSSLEVERTIRISGFLGT